MCLFDALERGRAYFGGCLRQINMGSFVVISIFNSVIIFWWLATLLISQDTLPSIDWRLGYDAWRS